MHLGSANSHPRKRQRGKTERGLNEDEETVEKVANESKTGHQAGSEENFTDAPRVMEWVK